MYIQLSSEVSIRVKDIIGVFDVSTTLCNIDSSEFLKISDEEGFVLNLCGDIPKSLVITEVEKNSKIFLSPISSTTLNKRINEGKNT